MTFIGAGPAADTDIHKNMETPETTDPFPDPFDDDRLPIIG